VSSALETIIVRKGHWSDNDRSDKRDYHLAMGMW